MKNFLRGFFIAIVNIAALFFCYVREAFRPPTIEKKSFKAELIGKVRSVVLNAKAWSYSLFSRWHIDSYNFA